MVLANDGKGTNVFSGFGNAKYTIIEGAAKETTQPKPEEKPVEKGVLPPLPEISSPSHPDESIWYSNNTPEFTWKILPDLTGVSYEITDKPTDDPGSVSDGIVESVKLEAQPDGEWYFHVKYQNRYGWGLIAHRKVLIDATPPEAFTVSVDNDGDPTNPAPKLRFTTTDKASGISVYNITLGVDKYTAKPDEVAGGFYQLPVLAPASYEAQVTAVDQAGNSTASKARFMVEPLKAPIITDVPKVIDRNAELIIRGTSFYPGATIKLYIGPVDTDAEEYEVTTDSEGNWSYFHKDKLKKGNYEIWAKLYDARGAQSLDSTKNVLTVIAPAIIETFGWWIIILLLIIIVGLVMYILYQRKEFNDEKRRIMGETKEVKSKLGKIFAALREEVDELIELADKRPGLSDAERRVKEKLEESLDISEEFIAKEVEDVEKEIKLKKKKEEKK